MAKKHGDNLKRGDRVKVHDTDLSEESIHIVVSTDRYGQVLVEVGKHKSGLTGWKRDSNVPASYKSTQTNTYWWVHKRVCTKVSDGEKGKKKALPKFDKNILKGLVLDDEVKEEILSVLAQHQHYDLIFRRWGLGELLGYGKGMSLMFYGPPGTGKTHAANIIAQALGYELLSINAANIQSSEPGGANRAIQQAFATAKEEEKLLFMDECDSLIYNRQHLGMILGGEVNTLLTELENHDGLTILATNRVDHMDDALNRRIALSVEFAEPPYEHRLELWKYLIPSKMPLAADVNIAELAEYELTGGLIKNVVLNAARLSVLEEGKKMVAQRHFERAIERVSASKKAIGTHDNLREGVSNFIKSI